MKEARYFYVPNAATETEIPEEEAMHALKVLRLKSGDDMVLMDGNGTFYEAEVTVAATKKCMYKIVDARPQIKGWNGYIHLVIAPTKNIDRIEWLVEKATEIGFDEITFLESKFSERKQIRIHRLEKIVVAAMKQSRKPWKPVINDIVSFKNFIMQRHDGYKYICHCYNEYEKSDVFNSLLKEKPNNVTILIGPEGDFSTDEVEMALQQGYRSASLGNSRLRTETAGLTAIMMAQLVFRKE